MRSDIMMIFKVIKTIYRTNKKSLFLMLLKVTIKMVEPFPALFLTKEIVKVITTTDSKLYIPTILFYSILIVVISVLSKAADSVYVIESLRLKMLMQIGFMNKCMEINYEEISSDSVLNHKQLAQNVYDKLNDLLSYIVNFTSSISLVVISAIILLKVDYLIIIVAIFGCILNVILSKMNNKRKYDHDVKYASLYRKFDYFNDLFANFNYAKEIRVFNMFKRFNPILDQLTEEYYDNNVKVFSFSRLQGYVSSVTSLALTVSTYLFLGYKVLVTKSIGCDEFTFLSGMVFQFTSSISTVTDSYLNYRLFTKYLNAYYGFINLDCRITRPGTNSPESSENVCIEFHNVSFTYPGAGKSALKNINLEINTRETIAIVGENGAGKTTFIKLLMGLYIPTEGYITYNGMNLCDLNCQDYLKLFSAVFQDYKLFAFSVRDNVTMLTEDENMIGDEKINSLLHSVGMKSKSDSFPKGLSTNVTRLFDKEGIEFSGGEAQKLALVRAMLKNSKILVLDEPTSALDPRTENEIYNIVRNKVNDKTIIFVSHRLASTKFCDRIIVFDKGEIAQEGTHEALLEQKGLYKELYLMQANYYS